MCDNLVNINSNSQIKLFEIKNPKRFRHPLQIYKDYPLVEMNLRDLRTITIDRLNLLHFLENYKIDSCENTLVLQNLQSKMCCYLLSLENNVDRQIDDVSHHILKLAFCNDEYKRNWLIKRESDLFLLRTSTLSIESIRDFFKVNNFVYPKEVDDVEKQTLVDVMDSFNINFADILYKISFLQVAPLVKLKNVYLKHGQAYISEKDLSYVILHKFSEHLRSNLSFLGQRLHALDDPRVLDLLKEISKLHTIITKHRLYKNYNKKINASDLDILCKLHYPPCMRNIHLHFRKKHHMPYSMRMQYGLFTKNIGLPFNDAYEFWKNEFTKIMNEEKFRKKYSYLIKHQYGMVGSKIEYTCYNCTKIISKTPGYSENHGCPFAHYTNDDIKEMLKNDNFKQTEISDIEDLVSKNLHTKACAKYFHYRNKEDCFDNMYNPCDFYVQSINLEEANDYVLDDSAYLDEDGQ